MKIPFLNLFEIQIPNYLKSLELFLKKPEASPLHSAPQAEELKKLESPRLSREQQFFLRYADYAMQSQRTTGIPASVTLAQAALESNYGKSAPGHNFFGVKGEGPAGSQLLNTWEVYHGKKVRVKAKFRRYHSPFESFVDHGRVIAKSRYLKHAMQHTESASSFINALQSGPAKYATDPDYATKILKLIARHRLESYDQKTRS